MKEKICLEFFSENYDEIWPLEKGKKERQRKEKREGKEEEEGRKEGRIGKMEGGMEGEKERERLGLEGCGWQIWGQVVAMDNRNVINR